jgi:AraC family transcriptional regulator
MIREETSRYYRKKVDDLLGYIRTHLDDDLSVRTLSLYSGISLYHFHRIMKVALGEPLGSYIDRIRLDTSVRLIRYSQEPLQQIALSIGYSDISSFSKAFTREFGLSPGEYRSDPGIILNTHIDYRVDNTQALVSDIKPKLINLPEKQVLFLTVIGEYGGESTIEGWNEIEAFMKQQAIHSWRPDLFAIYYDDPDEVGADQCRTDLCLAVRKRYPVYGRIGEKRMPGGKYAVFRYKGPYEKLWELYYAIYGNWVMITDLALRDQPVIERYLTFSPQTQPENLLTEIYVPVE